MERHHGVEWKTAIAAAALLSSNVALAAGFEKSVPFSGRYGGIVGAGASVAEGPEALYFNPAALGASDTPEMIEKRARLSLNFSPTPTKFEGSLSNGSMPLSTDPKVSPMFAAFGGFGLTRDLTLGAGIYTSGGSNVAYEGIEVSPVFARTELASELQITEASAGLGYELVEGLELGAAFRQAIIRGEYSSFVFEREGYTLSQIRYTDLRASRPGFRLGARYAPKGAGFGVGLAYRSRIDFNAKGRLSGHLQSLAGPRAAECAAAPCEFQVIAGGLASSFPAQLNVGGFFDLTGTLRTVLEYSFSEYGRNRRISATGQLVMADGEEVADMKDMPIELGWNHQHQGKLGLIYTGLRNWTLRGGYSLVGQVTPKSKASPTFAPPANTHVVALGVGAQLGPVMTDVAYEFSTSKGTGEAPRAGEYSAEAHALHAGLSLGF